MASVVATGMGVVGSSRTGSSTSSLETKYMYSGTSK